MSANDVFQEGSAWVITAESDAVVTDAAGFNKSIKAGEQVVYYATGAPVEVESGRVSFSKLPAGVTCAPGGSGGGLSGGEKSFLEHLEQLFTPAIPEGEVSAPAVAIPDSWFVGHFSRYAQPGMPVAPGNVFVSRVPYARNVDGSWVNTGCAMSDEVDPREVKLLDNYYVPADQPDQGRPLAHKCSTDTTENVDDYVGKRWAFYWCRCNYMTDAWGVKWVTAVEGFPYLRADGTVAEYDPALPTGVFGPSIWTFCCLDTGWGTEEDGTPNYQLWGIGDSPWENLSSERREWLESHGVTSADYKPWSTGLWYTGGDQGEWRRRSYICESAYCGTAVVDSRGQLTGISSVRGKPHVNNLSHTTMQELRGRRNGGGARACALALIYDIVKNATKNSQNIHYGLANYNTSGLAAAANTVTPGRVVPIAAGGAAADARYELGVTVYMSRTQESSSRSSAHYLLSATRQAGRVVAIRDESLEVYTGDPTAEGAATERKTYKCLVLSEDAPEFVCRTSKAYADAVEDGYAFVYANPGAPLAGETDAVIGKHDGYYHGTNGRHPYRVQGMEMSVGYFQMAADCVCVKGNGSTQVTLPDGSVHTPTSGSYVYLYSPSNKPRNDGGSLAGYISGRNYIPVAIGTATSGFAFNAAVEPTWGVLYVTATGASDHTGHADQLWTGASPAPFCSGGVLSLGSSCGSSCAYLSSALGFVDWYYGARD